ncbi:uncharacterized protein LOC122306319 [Carya illinoinensis]|uniref:uncharacterized protein LOC122306319 n=1 Tax=Carya illinoinensis TaxID=32201 RepID=UPI001C724C22|nr:uncharacterized protein LOC122306319 [Carya illinoinensis]
MDLFRQVLIKGSLFDLGWRGDKYTWSNRHEDASFTKERLDRVLANQQWMEGFANYQVDILTAICSDHKLVLLSCLYAHSEQNFAPHSFKYEASWSREEGCSTIVATEWQKQMGGVNKLASIQTKLEACSKKLRQWSRHIDQDRSKAIKEKTRLINQLQRDEGPSYIQSQKQLHKELEFLLEQEDLKWKQRAKRH